MFWVLENDFTQREGPIADVTAALWAVDLMLPPPSRNPGSWAMMLLGFASIGAVMRRRRGHIVVQIA